MEAERWKRDLSAYLPEKLKKSLFTLDEKRSATLEEIRVRVHRPVQLIGSDYDELLWQESIDERLCAVLLEGLSEHSIYAYERERSQGYFTIRGGYRVGICGRMGGEGSMAEVSGFNIRIAREWKGCADNVMPHLVDGAGAPVSALLLSAPGVGKTTMLRDIARQFSDGKRVRARKVAIADERGEIAGCYLGTPLLDVGQRTDVMDGYPKAQAVSMLIRSMSPAVIITDEIGGSEDALALRDASQSGVAVVASAHAGDRASATARPELRALLEEGLFRQIIELYRAENRVYARVIPA
ncbi:MAG: stage III sporulation protein AA [Clostridia bacterium]|nr:stage III sporulation protein AA [Clostridia bacterium]